MTHPHRGGRGDVVIGVMLVFIGIALLLTRAGVVHWSDRFTLWPVILFGIGLARLLQSRPGEPRQGLLFLVAGAWLFAVEGGWISLEHTWPWLIIGFGVAIALNGGVRARKTPIEQRLPVDPTDRAERRRNRARGITPLAVLGIWLAVALAVKTSGLRSVVPLDGRSDLNVTSVMGQSEYASNSTDFRRASVAAVMGRAELDLRNAKIVPGGEAVVEVFGVMGTPVIRVPRDWVVDVSALPVMARIRDERFTPAEAEAETTGPAPRLVLRGFVVMGGLVITS